MQKLILCAAALVVSAAPLLGQAPADTTTPRFDVGTATAVLAPPHADTATAVLLGRVGVSLTQRFAIEGAAGLFPEGLAVDHLHGAYTIQGRYRLRSLDRTRTSLFMTFGGTGGFSRYRSREFRWTSPDGTERVYPRQTYADVTLPIAATVGLDVQREISQHVAIRAGAQAVVCPYFDRVGVSCREASRSRWAAATH